jgi:hypothetical protein
LKPPAIEKCVGADEEGIGPLARDRRKCRIDLVAGAGVEDLDLQPNDASRRFDLFLRAFSRCNIGDAPGTSSRSSSSRFATNSAL